MLNGNPNPRSVDDERDWKTQRAVLALLLFAHPLPLTRERISDEIGDPDAAERAMVELTLVGLSWGEGKAVLPTMAAVHFDWLEMQ